MGSESEDNYNDRGSHKRERSSRVSAGAGIRGCERVEGRERGGGLISPKEKEDSGGQDEGQRERGARIRERERGRKGTWDKRRCAGRGRGRQRERLTN